MCTKKFRSGIIVTLNDINITQFFVKTIFHEEKNVFVNCFYIFSVFYGTFEVKR